MQCCVFVQILKFFSNEYYLVVKLIHLTSVFTVYSVQSFVVMLLIITIIGSGSHRLSLLAILGCPT